MDIGEIYYVVWQNEKGVRCKQIGWLINVDEKELLFAQTFSMTPLPVVRVPRNRIMMTTRFDEP